MQKLAAIFDYSNLMTRILYSPPIMARTKFPDYNQLRFMAINSIYISMFTLKATEIIIAEDSKPSWRLEIYPRYKESRKKKRDKIQDVDFESFYRENARLLEDIKEYLPFKVLKVPFCEADDIVGVLSLENLGFKVVIVSTDKDYLQLCSNSVRIYNPIKRVYDKVDDTEDFIVRASLSGQKGKEDITNVKTPLDWPDGKRKPPLGPEGIEKIMRSGYKEWLKSEGLMERFELNRRLIDFKFIPENIKANILKAYSEAKIPEISKAYEFFKENKFNTFLEDYHKIENNLLRIYEN